MSGRSIAGYEKGCCRAWGWTYLTMLRRFVPLQNLLTLKLKTLCVWVVVNQGPLTQ